MIPGMKYNAQPDEIAERDRLKQSIADRNTQINAIETQSSTPERKARVKRLEKLNKGDRDDLKYLESLLFFPN